VELASARASTGRSTGSAPGWRSPALGAPLGALATHQAQHWDATRSCTGRNTRSSTRTALENFGPPLAGTGPRWVTHQPPLATSSAGPTVGNELGLPLGEELDHTGRCTRVRWEWNSAGTGPALEKYWELHWKNRSGQHTVAAPGEQHWATHWTTLGDALGPAPAKHQNSTGRALGHRWAGTGPAR
jgi:hypothetical protein